MRMTNRDPEQEQFRESDNDLDRALDDVLAKLAAVEPRAGLENRILACVREERAWIAGRVGQRRRNWQWAMAMATLVLAVALVWTWRLREQREAANPPLARIPDAEIDGKPPATQIAHGDTSSLPVRGPTPARRLIEHRLTEHRPPRESLQTEPVAPNPKLDQFPSPQPLSEQEQILARYIAQDPERATLVAEARMQVLQVQEQERQAISDDGENMRRRDRRLR